MCHLGFWQKTGCADVPVGTTEPACVYTRFIANDIENVAQRGVAVFTPVKEVEKRKQEGKDPYAPQPGDTPGVSQWRQRMGTAEAQKKYRDRCKCEFPNALCRNHGLQQFLVRGLEKVKAVVYWHALVINLVRLVALRAQKASTQL